MEETPIPLAAGTEAEPTSLWEKVSARGNALLRAVKPSFLSQPQLCIAKDA